jgi:hypothetical protein
MKAFMLSLVALAAITVVSAFVLQSLPISSSDLYSERPNVRL